MLFQTWKWAKYFSPVWISTGAVYAVKQWSSYTSVWWLESLLSQLCSQIVSIFFNSGVRESLDEEILLKACIWSGHTCPHVLSMQSFKMHPPKNTIRLAFTAASLLAEVVVNILSWKCRLPQFLGKLAFSFEANSSILGSVLVWKYWHKLLLHH